MVTDSERQALEDQYKVLVDFHPTVKGLVARCELTDPGQRAPIAAVAELRSALDHIMRAHRVMYGLVDEQEILDHKDVPSVYEYCRINIDKGLGHLYRAGYDAYDLLCLRMNQDIHTMLVDRETDVLYAVVPEYASLKASLDELRETTLAGLKVDKDVEGASQEKSVYDRYEEAMNTLSHVRDTLQAYIEQVLEYEEEMRHRDRSGVVIQVLIAVVFLLLGYFALPYFFPGPPG